MLFRDDQGSAIHPARPHAARRGIWPIETAASLLLPRRAVNPKANLQMQGERPDSTYKDGSSKKLTTRRARGMLFAISAQPGSIDRWDVRVREDGVRACGTYERIFCRRENSVDRNIQMAAQHAKTSCVRESDIRTVRIGSKRFRPPRQRGSFMTKAFFYFQHEQVG